MKPRTRRPPIATVSLAAAVGSMLLLGGCYENVVGVKGPGFQNYDIHEANIEPGESVWSEDKPHPVDPKRYGGSTTVERAKPIPTKTTKTN